MQISSAKWIESLLVKAFFKNKSCVKIVQIRPISTSLPCRLFSGCDKNFVEKEFKLSGEKRISMAGLNG